MEEEVKEEAPIRLASTPQLDCEVREKIKERIKKSKHYHLEALKRHNVIFSFYDAGCTITVGCKMYAFSNIDVALEEFYDYVKNTEKAYEKWNK